MQIKFKNEDYTAKAKIILQTVYKILSSKSKDFTVNHYIEILKGSKIAKLISEEHDKTTAYGKLSSFAKFDIERLLRKMISERILKEEMKVLQHENIAGYVRIGEKAKDLFEDRMRFEFPIVQNSKTVQQQRLPILEEDEDASKLSQLAYEALEEVSKEIAKQINVHHHNFIPLEALRVISIKLPTSKAEFLKIPNVTKEIYEKHGAKFQRVTKDYKSMLDEQRKIKETDANLFDEDIDIGGDEEESNMDFDSINPDSPSTSTASNFVSRNNNGRSSFARGGKASSASRGGKKSTYNYKSWNNKGGITKKKVATKKSPYFKTNAKKGKFSFNNFKADSW